MKSDVDTENLTSLGYVELQAKDYDEAIDYFTRVLDIDGRNSKAWFGKGYAVLRDANTQINRYEEALVYFQNGIRHCSESEKEELTDKFIEEFAQKKFHNAHIEFLDKLIDIRPHKKFLLSLVTVLQNLEDGMVKSGNKPSKERQVMKDKALLLLKEADPKAYDTFLKNREGKNKQEKTNIQNDFESRKKEVFSKRRIINDTIANIVLNLIITAFILIALNAAEDTFGRGITSYLAIFLVLTFFSQVAVYLNKKREIKRIEKQYAEQQKDRAAI
jgi:tetratricopeptide (TPR) repeat protein